MTKEGKQYRKKYYFLALLFFILALTSKPMAVSLPAVLLILDWYPLEKIRSLKTFLTSLTEKMPFIALGIASSVLTVLAQKSGGAMGLMETVPLPARLLLAVKSLVSYLLNMLLPVNLVFYYPYPREISFLSAEYIVPLFLVVCLTAASFIIAKKNRLLPSLWAYYVVTLIPVLGIVQVGLQAMADRYTYLPGIAPFLAAGLTSAWALSKADKLKTSTIFKRLAAVLSVILILLLSYLTIVQTATWKDSIMLWGSIIDKMPDYAFFAYHNRAIAYGRMGELDKAIADCNKAIAINPRFADAYSNLGALFFKKGMLREAIDEYKIAIRLNPGFSTAHQNLASTLYTSGRYQEALEHYRIVADLRPGDADAQAELGAAYGATGAYDKAIEHLEAGLQVRYANADAHYNLATAYRLTGNSQKAREHYEVARRLNPNITGPASPAPAR